MNFLEMIQIDNEYLGREAWVMEVFIIVLITGFINWVQKKLHNRIISKLEKTRTFWDDAFFEATKKPVSFLIWISGIALSLIHI